jgi:hypothetical protein
LNDRNQATTRGLAAADCLWLRGALRPEELSALDSLVEVTGRPGERVAWQDPASVTVLSSITAKVRQAALPGAFIVRAVAFEKNPEVNWGVPWHQDRVIAVAERYEVAGFSSWSCKAGVWHCEPPASILTRMYFARIHLDPCDEQTGALEIARGSHLAGVVAAIDADRVAAGFPTGCSVAERGDIQILPMLVLHRSRPSRRPHTRRVLRLDFAAGPLPSPLEWLVG